MFERLTLTFKTMIDLLLGTNLVSPNDVLARLVAKEALLKEEIKSLESRDVPNDVKDVTLDELQLAYRELYSDELLTAANEQLKQLQEEIAEYRRRLIELEKRDKAAQATITKATEILSKSTPDGALSIMERMETKVRDKEGRQEILVAKAITEIGTTYDREVHPVPARAPQDQFPMWIPLSYLLMIAVIMALVAYWY